MDIKEWLPEFRVSAEADEDLLKYFLKTEYVSEIINRKKWLVLGRKGTGKTAIYEYIKSAKNSELDGFRALTLSFKDYPWPTHHLYKEAMEGELSAYQRSWFYLFIVQAVAQLIKVKEMNKEPISNDLKSVKKILQQIYGNPFPSLIEVIKSKIIRVDKLSAPQAKAGDISLSGGEVSFEEISQSEGLKRKLKDNAFSLLTYLEDVFLKNAKGHKFIICLDRLDDNWLKDQIPEYSKILINLINVSQFINTAGQYRGVLRIIIFLRTDIYDTLSFNDKNKISQDSAVEIFWDEESLNNMFLERIKRNKPTQLNLDFSLKTNSIFDVKYIRHGATPLKHMLRRTFLRPRDLIVFANKIRLIHIPGKSGLYSSKDIYSAEKDFSESMYNELIDEWANQMPKIKDHLAILQNIRFSNFTYNKFAEQAQRVLKSPTRAEMLDILRFLFQNSIIGQKISANWEFSCANPHMQIDFGKPFHVNAGLKDRLMLTDGSAR